MEIKIQLLQCHARKQTTHPEAWVSHIPPHKAFPNFLTTFLVDTLQQLHPCSFYLSLSRFFRVTLPTYKHISLHMRPFNPTMGPFYLREPLPPSRGVREVVCAGSESGHYNGISVERSECPTRPSADCPPRPLMTTVSPRSNVQWTQVAGLSGLPPPPPGRRIIGGFLIRFGRIVFSRIKRSRDRRPGAIRILRAPSDNS